MEGKTQQTAAAMAGMSERSARKWQCGPLLSETKQERWWRTRSDPFDGVREEEIEPLLQGEAAGQPCNQGPRHSYEIPSAIPAVRQRHIPPWLWFSTSWFLTSSAFSESLRSLHSGLDILLRLDISMALD